MLLRNGYIKIVTGESCSWKNDCSRDYISRIV